MQCESDKVDTEIESITRVLSRTPDDDPNMGLLLLCLANAYNKRFGLRKEPYDIHEVIKYRSIALTLIPDDDLGLPELLSQLGTAYIGRFKRLGDRGDTEKAIEYISLALELSPKGDSDLPRRLANLAVAHRSRFEDLRDLGGIDKAIEYDSRAVEMTQNEDPSLPGWLNGLGTSYGCRFKWFGELKDLESAIEYRSRALDLTPDSDPHLWSRATNLATTHRDRFKRLGELRDLDQAITYQSRAVALTTDNYLDLQICLGNLAVLHNDRFELLGELKDLEQAIEHGSRALALTPEDHPHLPTRLTNLAVSHKIRFRRLGELSDLEKAVNCDSRVLALTPDDHPLLPGRLANLLLSYCSRFRRLGDLNDLEQAISHGSRALALTPDDHPDLPNLLTNLAESHQYRFRHLNKLSDLEQAIEYESCALAVIPRNHPDSCLLHNNHAISYISYYNYSHNPSHLQESLHFFRSACMLPSGVPRYRFRNARQWTSHASKHSALNTIEAYQTAIDLLPQFIWLGATSDQRYQDLKSVETLAVDAAHAAIVSSDFSLALEWLEHARCIVWSQNLMLRSPFDQLLESHPILASRLQKVADQLQNAGLNSRESQAFSRSIPSEQVAQDHRRLAQEYEQLLAQARTLPGFEDFLRPMKAAGLMRAPRNGPIVVINCHEQRCDALVVLPGYTTVAHLPLLGFTGKKARGAHSIIQAFLRCKGIRERGFCILQGPGRQIDFGSVLEMLWTDVVKPILDFLGLTVTTGVTPQNLPHITWCPTGSASFLPLHAAGDYDQPHLRAFNYAVSSYTPTLTALLGSTPSTLNHNSHVLAIGQAATPDLGPLPGTIAELGRVKSHVENRAGYSELTGAQATPATVLDAMELHDWLHIACHAHQNVKDPTQSGFFLHDGTLDLAAINRRSFKRKGLAFLSACQTATGDETLADEAVHLASGMLMAGYSSVIGTMWSVADADAPFVADKVYSQLMEKGTLGNWEAGTALHHAVEGLREMVGEKEFGRWVPYIHIGS